MKLATWRRGAYLRVPVDDSNLTHAKLLFMRHCAPSSLSLSPCVRYFLCISVFVAFASGQANVQGQWTTLPNTIPINPVHATLLANGKILIVAGSGNCTPSLNRLSVRAALRTVEWVRAHCFLIP